MSLTPFELMILTELLEVSQEFNILTKHMEQVGSPKLPHSFGDGRLQLWIQCRNTKHVHSELASIPGPFYTQVMNDVNGAQYLGDKCMMHGDIVRNYGEAGK